jgi:hypothetical protein
MILTSAFFGSCHYHRAGAFENFGLELHIGYNGIFIMISSERNRIHSITFFHPGPHLTTILSQRIFPPNFSIGLLND